MSCIFTLRAKYFTNGVLICFGILQAGGFPEPEIIHYNPKDYDFGKKKAFPFRDQVSTTIS